LKVYEEHLLKFLMKKQKQEKILRKRSKKYLVKGNHSKQILQD